MNAHELCSVFMNKMFVNRLGIGSARAAVAVWRGGASPTRALLGELGAASAALCSKTLLALPGTGTALCSAGCANPAHIEILAAFGLEASAHGFTALLHFLPCAPQMEALPFAHPRRRALEARTRGSSCWGRWPARLE